MMLFVCVVTYLNGLYSVCAETLRQYFSRYGDIVDCMVMKDPTTKRSRYEPYDRK